MPISRRLPLFARFVLAAWLLVLGSAIAAPVAKPAALEMICSGGVMKLVVQGQNGPAPVPDCPLCSPPALVSLFPGAVAGIVPAVQEPPPAGRQVLVASFLAVAPPARGPPPAFLA